MPFGLPVTATVGDTTFVATVITETTLPAKFATYTLLPFGLTAKSCGPAVAAGGRPTDRDRRNQGVRLRVEHRQLIRTVRDVELRAVWADLDPNRLRDRHVGDDGIRGGVDHRDVVSGEIHHVRPLAVRRERHV